MEPTELAIHVISGAIAGTVVEAALYPLDTIKTRLQVARNGARVNWNNLYRGLGGNLVGVIPSTAVFFAVYEPMKRVMISDADTHLVSANLCAAASGGLASSLIRVPTEVIKTRLQTGRFLSARHAVWYIATTEGICRGLYAGFGSFLLRDLPFDAIEFTSYDNLKLWRKRCSGESELKQHETAIFGALAGMFTGAITTPLDVVKTRLMSQGLNQVDVKSRLKGIRLDEKRYQGFADCLCRVATEEGWAALIKGIGPRVTWIGLGGGIFFLTLETSQRCMKMTGL